MLVGSWSSKPAGSLDCPSEIRSAEEDEWPDSLPPNWARSFVSDDNFKLFEVVVPRPVDEDEALLAFSPIKFRRNSYFFVCSPAAGLMKALVELVVKFEPDEAIDEADELEVELNKFSLTTNRVLARLLLEVMFCSFSYKLATSSARL